MLTNVKIYQADINWHNKFMPYDFVMSHGGINREQYKKVFDGELNTFYLDDIYHIFNVCRPEGFTGHSLSVGDIVMVDGVGTYFVDTFGFKEIDFKGD